MHVVYGSAKAYAFSRRLQHGIVAVFLSLLLLALSILPAAAQNASWSLEISPDAITTGGATLLVTPKNATFIGTGRSSLVSVANADDYPGMFDGNGNPTALFRSRITLARAPPGLRITGVTLDNRTQGTHGLAAHEHHREARVSVAYTGPPLTTDLEVAFTVDASLLHFADANGNVPGVGGDTGILLAGRNLSHSLTLRANRGAAALEFDGVPVRASEGKGASGYRTALRNDPGAGKTVTVTPTSSDPGAATVSPATMTFTGGDTGTWQTPQRVTVTPVDDADGAHEALFVNHAISGLMGVTDGGLVRVRVTDDERPGVRLRRRSHTFYGGDPAGTTSSYTIRLTTAPTDTVTITLQISDHTYISTPSLDGVDFTTFPYRITFGPDDWTAAKTVQFEKGRTTTAGMTTIAHQVSSRDTVYNGMSVPSVTVSYDPFEGRPVGRFVFDETTLTVEEDASETYTVALRANPGASTVNVALTSSDPRAATVAPASLSFNSSNWSSPRTVTVTPAPDSDTNDETVTMRHAVGGQARNEDNVQVTVTDTVAAGLVFDSSLVTVYGNETASYALRLRTPPGASGDTVTVRVSVSDPSVIRFADRSTTQTVTFGAGNWNRPQRVTLAHAGGQNGSVTVYHALTSTDANYNGLNVDLTAQAAATRPTNANPRAVLSVGSTSVAEGGNIAVTVTLVGGNAPAAAKIIPLVYTNGSAADNDYTAVGNVRIPANQRSAAATVAIVDDNVFEGDETFTIALGEPPFGVLPPLSTQAGSFEITIGAGDKPEIGIVADAASVTEGVAAGFTITAGNPAQAGVAVGLTVSREGNYLAANQLGVVSRTLPAGQTSLDLDLATANLATDNPSGSVSVALNASSSYTIKSGETSGKVAVIDDEPTTVTLSAPTGNVAETNGSKVISVTLGRGLVAGESLSLPLTVGGTAVLGTDYTLSAPGSAPTGVTYQTLGSAPTIVFTGPENGASATAATLTLSAVHDTLDEGDGETATFALPALDEDSGAGLAGGASGSGDVDLTITDDDDAPAVSVQGPAFALTEGDTATFTINVTGASQETRSIGFTVAQTGAFVASGAIGVKSLNLAPGATRLTHAIATIADEDDEHSGSLTLTLNAGTGYTVGSGDAGSATVAVTDDDPTGVQLSTTSGNIPETGGAKTITVAIDRGLVAGESLALPLTIGGTATLGTDYTLSAPGSKPAGVAYKTLETAPVITFTGPDTGRTDTSATLTLRATSDVLDEGASESVTMALPALNAGSGTGLDAGARGTGSIDFNIVDDDVEPEISLTRQGSGHLTEGEGLVLRLSANKPPTRDLSINLNVTGSGDFLASADVGAQSIKLAAGVSEVNYTLATVTDLSDEPSGWVSVDLNQGDGYTVDTANRRIDRVDVRDDDATSVTLDVPAGDVSESSGTKTFTVTLGRGLVRGETLQVNLRLTGAAQNGADYTLAAPSQRPQGVTYANLTVAPRITFTGPNSGQTDTAATLILNAVADTLIEGNENVTVGMASLPATHLHGRATGSGGGSFSITDGSGTAEISVSAGSGVTEGMDAKFTLTSSLASTTSRSIDLTVTQGGDFVSSAARGSHKAVIPAGATETTFAVPTRADTLDEPSGSATLTINSGTGYTIASGAGSASVAVADDDGTGVTLAATDTTATEGDSAATAGFTVTLSRALSAGETLQVPLAVTGLAAVEYSLALTAANRIGLSGNTLTFTGGTNAARTATLTLTANADSDTERDAATVTIPASSARGTPRMTATGLDGGASGSGRVRITVTDAGAAAGVTLSGAMLTVDEGGEGRYSIVLNSDPGGSVTIGASSGNTDVTLSPSSLTFTGGASGNWNTPQWITVTAATDGDAMNDSATISHTINGYTGVTTVPNVTVTVTDTGSGFTVTPGSLRVVAGSNATYTVKLKSAPTASVVLNVASDDAEKATVTPSTVTIAPGAWQTGATVTVTGVAAGTANVSHAHGSPTDTIYGALTAPAAVPVTVLAAAQPVLSISTSTPSVTEGGNAAFRVESDINVTARLDPGLSSVQEGNFASGALPTVTTLSGSNFVTLGVSTTNDSTDEPDGSLTVSVKPGAAYGLGNSASASVVFIDNDPTRVTLSGSGNIAETGGEASLTVTLGRALVEGEALPVPLSFTGTATFGIDYTLAAPAKVPAGVSYGNLTTATPRIVFTGGTGASATATLRVLATSDTTIESSNETVSVAPGTLGDTSGTGLGGGARGSGSASFTILDDDGANPTVSITAGSNVTEGTEASFTVSASPAPSSNLTVNLNVGQMGDFVSPTNAGEKTVTINAGDETATFRVTTAGDSKDEPDGSVSVAVAPGSGYALSGAAATVAVSDDDPTGISLSATTTTLHEDTGRTEIRLTLGRALVSGESLTQALSFGGTATFGTDYSLSTPSPPPPGVTFRNFDSTDPATDPPTIVFTGTAGKSRTATFTLTSTADTDVETGLAESVQVQLGTRTTQGLSGGVNAGTNSLRLNIIEDDRADTPTVSVRSGSAEVNEGASASFTLTSTSAAPSDGLSVSFTVSRTGDITAAGAIGAGKSVTIASGETEATHTIVTTGDSNDEPLGAVKLALAAGTGYNVHATRGLAAVNVKDNDPTGVTWSGSTDAIAETNGAKVFTVALERPLASGETLPVPLAFSGDATRGTDYTLSRPNPPPAGVTYQLGVNPPTITFTGGRNVADEATFTLTASPDILDEGDGEEVTVGLGSLGLTSGTGLDGGASGSGSTTFDITDDDGTPVLSVTGGNPVTEGNKAVFRISAEPAPQENITVSLSVADDAVADFVAAGDEDSQQVQIPADAKSVTYEVDTDDSAADGDEPKGSVGLTIKPGTGYTVSSSATASVQVTDNDATSVTLSVPDASATEGSSSARAEIRIALGRVLVSGEKVVAPFSFSGGTAGDDFEISEPSPKPGGVTYALTTSPPSVTFTGGSGAAAAATIDLTAGVDADETDDEVTVALGTLTATGLDGGATGSRSGDGRIALVDAGAQPAVDLDMKALALNEGGATGRYRVKLHTNPGGTVTVTPSSGDEDRVTVSGSLTFNSTTWGDWQPVTVTALPDGDLVNNEIKVTHAVSGYGAITKGPEVTVSVVDRGRGVTVSANSISPAEGASQSYTLVLHSAPTRNVIITPTSGSTTTATVGGAVTFTPSNWKTPKPVQVTGVSSGSTRITHAITSTDTHYAAITPDPVNVSVSATARMRTSKEAITAVEHGAPGSYQVWLNTDPGGPVTVTPSTTNTSLTLSGALTFNSGNFSKPQTVTATVASDADTDSDSAVITHTVSGYAGVTSGPAVNVTIRDAGARVLVSPTSLSVREGETMNYNVTVTTQPTVPVYVFANTPDPGLVTLTPVFLTFGPGTGRTLQFTARGDAPGNTSIVHRVTSEDPAYHAGTVPTSALRVLPEHGVIATPTSLSVAEGGSGSYTLELTSNPGGAVTVTPSSDDTGALTVSSPLSFNAGNWDQPQPVTVNAPQDTDDSHESVTISHAVSGYGLITTGPDVQVAVNDDERLPVISVAWGSSSITEGGKAIITVSSDVTPAAPLTVMLSITQVGDFVASNALGSQSVIIPVKKRSATLEIQTAADNADERWGRLTATLAANAAYQITVGPRNSAEVRIVDDDPGSVTLTVPEGNIDETGGAKTLTLALNRPLVEFEIMRLRLTLSGDADPDDDYTLSAPDTLPAGVTYALGGSKPLITFTGPSAASATVLLAAAPDTLVEGESESVSIGLAGFGDNDLLNLGGGVTPSGSGAFAILDDDEATLPLVTVAPASKDAISEGDKAGLTLNVNPAPEEPIEVKVSIGEAAGSDFVADTNEVSRMVEIEAGATSKAFTVDTVNDSGSTADEPDGAVIATLGAGAGYDLGSPSTAKVPVTDNDPTRVTLATPDASAEEDDATDPATITLTLNRGLVSGESLVVPLGFAGATPGTDFTLACPTTMPTGVTCPNLGNANAAVTFTGPGTGSSSATVTLTLTVTEDDDTDNERVTVSIPPSTTGNPRLTATGLSGGASGSRTGPGEIVFVDNDQPPAPTVSLSVNEGGAVTEGGTLTLTAEVSEAPSGRSLSIPVERAATSTAAAGDYTLATSIAIADGQTIGTATLSARADNEDEPAETLRINLGAPPEGYANGANSGVDVTIADNNPTRVTLSTPDTTATEADATATAEIRLTLNRGLVAGETLAVPLQFAGGTAGTHFTLALSGTATGVSFAPGTSTVTFSGPTSGATDTTATLKLTAEIDDNATNDVVTVSIPTRSTGNAPRLTATGLGGGATGRLTGNRRITLTDAGLNLRTVGWAAQTLNVTETASAGSINVDLSSSGSQPLAFRVCLTDGSATFGADYRGVVLGTQRCTGTNATTNADFTIAAGASSRSVSFASITDNFDEPDETYTATLSLPTAVTGLGVSPATLTVTVRDDDPTKVSLAREGTGAINEGGKVTFTVSLERALVTGEVIDVPLPVSGTGVTTGDWSLATKSGASNTGVSLLGTNTATPTVRFAGAGAGTATLELTATEDSTAETGGETFTIALGSNQQFDADSDTNVGGGADPHGTHNSFSVAVNDPRTIGWTATTQSVAEGAAGTQPQVSVNANLSSSGSGTVTFRVCLVDGTATLGATGDYRGFAGDARCTGTGTTNPDPTITSGQSGRAVSFTVRGDGEDEPDETFSATLSLPNDVTGLSVNASRRTVTFTITDDDPTVVRLARVGSGVVYEGGTVTFRVSLERALVTGEVIDVPLPISGTGVTTGDWSLATKSGASNTGVSLLGTNTATPTVRFAGAGAETATLELTAGADAGGKTFTIALGSNQQFDADSDTNVGGGADPHGTDRTFNVTVSDGRTLGWATTTQSVAEGAAGTQPQVSVNASLSSGSGPVTFRVCLDGGTATLGASGDYRGFAGDARCTGTGTGNPDPAIASGQSSRAVNFPVRGDGEDEPHETFSATLSLPATTPGLGLDEAKKTLTVTIMDDDPTRVRLSAPAGNVSERGGVKTVTVDLGRALVAPEALTVPLTFGGTANRGTDYTVACENTSGGVQCRNLHNGNAEIVFTGGPGAKRTATLTLTGVEDSVEEGSESVTVALGTLNAGSGTNLGGGASGTGSVAFNINETSTAGFDRAVYFVEEDEELRIPVLLDQPAPERLNVHVYCIPGSARPGDYFITCNNNLTFRQGEDELFITGFAEVDTLVEGDEEMTVELKSSNPDTVIIGRGVATVTILDAQSPSAGVTVAPQYLRPTEGGQPFSYWLSLRKAPAGNVTITATSGDPAVVRLHPGPGTPSASATLTFTPSNWDRAQRVNVTPQDDADFDDERTTITHVVRGTGEYRGVTAEAVDVRVTDNEVPAVGISGGAAVAEGAAATFELTATPALTGAITVNVNVTSRDIGLAPGQAGARQVVVTRGRGTLTVQTADDTFDRNGEVTVAVEAGDGYAVGSPASASVTVNDNDPDIMGSFHSLALSGVTDAPEGGTYELNLSFEPRLAVNEVKTFTVTFGGSATRGTDYRLTCRPVAGVTCRNFDSGAASITIDSTRANLQRSRKILVGVFSLQIVEDNTAESRESLSISVHGQPLSLGIVDAPDSVTVTLSKTEYLVTEENGPSQPVFRVTPAAGRDWVLPLILTDGTAKAGEDYKPVTSTTVPAGIVVGHFDIIIVGNDVAEDEETFTVAIDTANLPAWVTAGSITSSTVILSDNDTGALVFAPSAVLLPGGGSGSYTVKLAKQPSADVTVTVSGHAGSDLTVDTDGDDTGNQDTLAFTPSNWNQAQTVSLSAIQDADSSNDQVTLTHTAAGGGYGSVTGDLAVTIKDADPQPTLVAQFASAVSSAAESAGTHNVQVTLNPAPNENLTLSYAVSGTATEGSDFSIENSGSVSVASSATSAVIPVKITDDPDNEVDETVVLTLTSGTGYAVGTTDVHTLTITDDDLSVTPAFTDIYEGETHAFTVSGIPSSYTSVRFGTGNSTASRNTSGGWTGSEDYRLLDAGDPATVLAQADTLTPSGGSVTFKVETRADGAAEGDETIVVSIDASTDGTHFTSLYSLSLSLKNGPRPRTGVTVAPLSLSLTEGGAAGSYTVVLDTAPAEDETVTVTAWSTDPDAVRVNASGGTPGTSAVLTFTDQNWNQAQTVTVTPQDDLDTADEDASINHTVHGTGEYDDVTAPAVAVAVTDNDKPVEVSISAGPGVTEGDVARFTVSANPAPQGRLRVSLAIEQTGDFVPAGQISGNQLVILTPSRATETVAIATDDDQTNEAHGSVTATVKAGSGYTVADPPNNTATIDVSDNDGGGVPVVSVTSAQQAGRTAFEGATLTFTLRVNPAPAADLSVSVNVTQPGNAFVNADSRGTGNRTLTIAANQSTETVEVDTVDDTAEETPSWGTVTVTVQAGSDYTVAGAPADAASATVSDDDGLPAISIADAEGNEGEDLEFEVTLSRAAAHEVRVSWGTNPETARARLDFEFSSGRLIFDPGETRKVIKVWAVDDAHDDPGEFFTLNLWNPQGATIADDQATGTIHNSDPMPRAWLGRFGRTVAQQALDGIAGRIEAARTPGFQGTFPQSGVGVGGGVGAGPRDGTSPDVFNTGTATDPDRRVPLLDGPPMTARDLLAGSAFTLTGKPDAHGGSFALWGRGGQAIFNGQDDSLDLDGTVTTGLLGADYARQDWLVGLALTHTAGDGGYSDPGIDLGAGTVDASLTAAIPYAAWQTAPRLMLWGSAGYGTGEVTLAPETPADPGGDPSTGSGHLMQTDIDWLMAAAGARGDLLTPSHGGPALSLTSDALWTRTASDKIANLTASEATVTRLRLGLAGSWSANFDDVGTLTPKLATGVRHDGGDAETGFGVELGGGLAWAVPRLGLALDLEGRTLLAHEADGFKDRGFAAGFAFDPTPASPRGPSLTFRQTWGSQASGGLDALFASDPLTRRTGIPASRRWTAEAAYGFPVFGGRFTGSPQLGLGVSSNDRLYTLGGQLTSAGSRAAALSFGVRATRRETASTPAAHGVEVELSVQW